MEPLRDDQLIADLQALRPTPRPQFAAELDERAAAGFPRRSLLPVLSFDRLREISPRRLLLPAGAAAVLAISAMTAVIVTNDGGTEPQTHFALSNPNPKPSTGAPEAREESAAGATAAPSASAAEEASGTAVEGPVPTLPSEVAPKDTPLGRLHHRAVERSAEVVLAATPDDVGITLAVPAFMLSELTTAFQMGVVILLPFLIIDLAVSSLLMSMGMMMVPPSTLALPIKLVLFVLVDGWSLIAGSLLRSFT